MTFTLKFDLLLKTFTLVITYERWEIGLSCFTCVFLVTRPFTPYHIFLPNELDLNFEWHSLNFAFLIWLPLGGHSLNVATLIWLPLGGHSLNVAILIWLPLGRHSLYVAILIWLPLGELSCLLTTLVYPPPPSRRKGILYTALNSSSLIFAQQRSETNLLFLNSPSLQFNYIILYNL